MLCEAGEGCDGVVVWDSVVWIVTTPVLICGVWLSPCAHGVGKGCGGIVVGDGGVLPSGMRLVFVGKLTCSHIFRLGVVWIVCS